MQHSRFLCGLYIFLFYDDEHSPTHNIPRVVSLFFVYREITKVLPRRVGVGCDHGGDTLGAGVFSLVAVGTCVDIPLSGLSALWELCVLMFLFFSSG